MVFKVGDLPILLSKCDIDNTKRTSPLLPTFATFSDTLFPRVCAFDFPSTAYFTIPHYLRTQRLFRLIGSMHLRYRLYSEVKFAGTMQQPSVWFSCGVYRCFTPRLES